MAVELTVQKLGQTGTAPTFTAADATGNYVVLEHISDINRLAVIVKNGGVGASVCTLNAQYTSPNSSVKDNIAVSVAAAGEGWIKPGPVARMYIDAGLKVSVDFDVVTSVTLAFVLA